MGYKTVNKCKDETLTYNIVADSKTVQMSQHERSETATMSTIRVNTRHENDNNVVVD